MQSLRGGILAGRALRERQCTLEGEAQYVNVQGSVQRKGVYTGLGSGQCEGVNFF